MMLVLVGEHCVSRLGQWTPRLALEVRRRFIFLGRPLPKNILCSILNILQVLTRQGMPAAPEATASFVQLVKSLLFRFYKLTILVASSRVD